MRLMWVLLTALLATWGVQAQSTQLWEKSAGDFSFFQNDGNTRGMGYNPATDHVLVAARTGGSFVYILDAATGDSLGRLDMTGVSGGTFPINIVRADADGVIYVGNLALGGAEFKVYRWADETAAPTLAFSGTVTNRTGDAMDVYGTGVNTVIYASGSSSTEVTTLTTADGATFAAGTPIPVSAGLARGGISPNINTAGADLWVNGSGTPTSHIDAAGNVIAQMNTGVVSSSWMNVRYMPSTLVDLVAITGNAGADNGPKIQFWDVRGSETDPSLFAVDSLRGQWNGNGNGTGDIAWKDNGDNSLTVYQLITGNGVAAYRVDLPVETIPDVVINEINYNGPEAGTDSSEFIEFYNAGMDAADLGGFSIVEGVTFTFPGGATLAADDYVVVAFDSVYFQATYGFSPDYQWTAGGLSNGGEDITLVSPGGTTVDSVNYDDANGWPIEPDGAGPTLERIDPLGGGNDPANWQASFVDRGTPGAPNSTQTVPDTVTNIWEKAVGDYAWFAADNNTRGMAYNPATGHLLVASRTGGSVVHIVDGADGSDLGSLDMTGVSGGIFPLNIVRVDANGVIYAANMQFAGSSFKVYRWENESAAPTVAFDGVVNSRTGDSFGLSGTGAATVLYASGLGSSEIVVLTTTDGLTYTAGASIPVASGLARGGISPIPSGLLERSLVDELWVNGAGTLTSHIDGAGNIVAQMDGGVVASSWFNTQYMPTAGGKKYVAVVGNAGSDLGLQAQIWDITDSETNPTRYAIAELTGPFTANANAAGDLAFVNNNDSTFTVYQMVTNHGIAAWTVTLPEQNVVNPVTIAQIQTTPDGNEGPSPLEGQTVETSGIVTAVNSNGFFLQDAPGEWNGIWVYSPGHTATVGDDVTFQALVEEFNGLTELTTLANFTVNSTGNTLPAATVVSTGDYPQEKYEGVLVRVENATVTDPDLGFGEFQVDDGSGPAVVDDLFYAAAPDSGAVLNITGPGYYSFGAFKIEPRDSADVEVVSVEQPIANVWEKSTADFSWFNADNNTRGMGYNPDTDHLLVASRSGGTNIWILDAATGDSLGSLDMNGVSGGTFPINIVRVDAAGVIYAGNLTLAGGSFKVYRWESESAAPTVAFDGVVPQRTGDSFGLSGSGANTVLYASGLGSTEVTVLSTTDGLTYTLGNAIPVPAGLARGGISPIPSGLLERSLVDELWVNGSGTPTSHIDGAGNIVAQVDGGILSSSWFNVAYFSGPGGENYIAVVGNAGSDVGLQVQVFDITASETNPTLFAVGELSGPFNANGNGAGDLGFRVNGDTTVTVFQMVTNNGIAAWELDTPDGGGVPVVTIAEIQTTPDGLPGPSPLEGQIVQTTGIATGANSNGYFLQDGPGAWNGVWVYSPGHTVVRGDEVTIVAEVIEYFDLTEMNSPSSTVVNSQGNTLPAAVVLSTADVNQEPYESVLATVENAAITDPDLGFGEFQIDDGSGPTRVDDLLFAFVPDSTRRYDITGPVYFSFSDFKMVPRDSADIVDVTIPVYPIAAAWEKSTADFTWFNNDNNTRGMGYNPVTDHLLVASRSGGTNIWILDAATGDSLGSLDMTGVSGGTFPINIVRVDGDGVIYAANLALGGGNYKIYRWADESAVPTVAFDGTVVNRTGDSFALTGTGTSTVLYGSGSGSPEINRFVTTDGVTFSADTAVPAAGGLARGGIAPIDNGAEFWVNGSGTPTSHIDASGAVIAQFDGGVVSASWFNVLYIPTAGDARYVAVLGNAGADVGLQLQVFDVSGSETMPDVYAIAGLTGPFNANGNAAADGAWKNNGDGTVTIYQMVTNNGIAAWVMDLPAFPMPVFSSDLFDFGETAVGASVSDALTITNQGTADFVVTGVRFAATDVFSTTLDSGTVILPDSALTVSVAFSPDTTGIFSDTLLIESNAGTFAINVSGVGFDLWPLQWRVLADTAAWFGTTNAVRTLGYSMATNHLYIATRLGGDRVRVMDAETGAFVKDLDMTGYVGGGLLPLNQSVAGDDGVIYAANLAQGSNFTVYRWSDEDAQLTVAHDAILTGRVGDALAVSGTGVNTELYVSGSGNDKIFILTTTDGLTFTQTGEITLPEADAARFGIAPVQDGDYFFINAPAKAPRYIKRDGTVLAEFPTTVLAGTSISYWEVATTDDTTRRFIGVLDGFSPGVRVAEMLGQPGDSLAVGYQLAAAPTPKYLTTANGNATAQVVYSPIDNNLLELVTNNGLSAYSFEKIVENDTVLVAIGSDLAVMPERFDLRQNYPNPFNPSTTIELAVPRASELTITIYNVLGERVGEVFRGRLQAGLHQFEFRGDNLASGLYFYRVDAPGFVQTRKMILLK